MVGFSTGHTPRRISAITLHMAEALAALALHREFRCDARLDRDRQAAQFSQTPHPPRVRAL